MFHGAPGEWPPFVAALAMLVVGGLALTPRPRPPANVALAAFLALQAAQIASGAVTDQLPTRTLAYNAQVYSAAFLVALDLAYVHFLLRALDTPLVRPLKTRTGRALLWLATPLVALPFVAPTRFVGPDLTPIGWRLALDTADAVVVTFALACAGSAWLRAAHGSVARRRARLYAIGFGIQDATVLAFYAIIRSSSSAVDWYDNYASPALFTIAMAVIGYAMLRWQLFDIDLRIRAGISRAALASFFVATFVIVAQLAQNYLTGALGWLVGGLAAGVLLVALRPLERIAERLASRAMPGVAPTNEYLAFKKLDVYRAAVESALEAGGIDVKERTMLDRLREKLGVAATDANAVEAEIRATTRA